jgi:peptide-methionine (R)-S-oxide reductase
MQFYVTQNHGTEPPFTGRLLHNKRDGVYHCLVCDAPLFNSQTKLILAAAGRAFTSR